jgi:hypothetical protein
MRLAGFEGEAQRLARPEQVLLADHLVRRLRAQLLGERGSPSRQAIDAKRLPGEKRRIPRQRLARQRQAGQRRLEIGSALVARRQFGQDQRIDDQRPARRHSVQLVQRPVGPLRIVRQNIDQHATIHQRG